MARTTINIYKLAENRGTSVPVARKRKIGIAMALLMIAVGWIIILLIARDFYLGTLSELARYRVLAKAPLGIGAIGFMTFRYLGPALNTLNAYGNPIEFCGDKLRYFGREYSYDQNSKLEIEKSKVTLFADGQEVRKSTLFIWSSPLGINLSALNL